jgi:hypothetical protein
MFHVEHTQLAFPRCGDIRLELISRKVFHVEHFCSLLRLRLNAICSTWNRLAQLGRTSFFRSPIKRNRCNE